MGEAKRKKQSIAAATQGGVIIDPDPGGTIVDIMCLIRTGDNKTLKIHLTPDQKNNIISRLLTLQAGVLQVERQLKPANAPAEAPVHNDGTAQADTPEEADGGEHESRIIAMPSQHPAVDTECQKSVPAPVLEPVAPVKPMASGGLLSKIIRFPSFKR